MSEDQAPETASVSETPKAATRVRRVSTPRPKKVAVKTADSPKEKVAAPKEVVVVTPKEVKEVVVASQQEPVDAPRASTVTEAEASQDWPDAETVSDANGKGGNDKRKRRRRKGKGGQNSQQSGIVEEVVNLVEAPQAPKRNEDVPQQSSPVPSPVAGVVASSARPPQQSNHQQNQNQQGNRQAMSPELLAKRAWKIFLAEVSEEGVSLISDQDARELSKRCFRLAEIFLDEQGRRLR